MSKKILIIGKGAAGRRHLKILKSLNKKLIIKIISSRQVFSFRRKLEINKIKKFAPDQIILASPSTEHRKFILMFEKNFINKIILVEKPLLDKYQKFSTNLKNKYFVGYNLRFHPVIQFIKNYLKKKKYFYIEVLCNTYLPEWRKNIDYYKTVSSQKNLGGGVLLELSHEIDYVKWIFGNIRIISIFNKKISNLKVDCDDILSIQAVLKKNIFFNLNINFFSRYDERKIKVTGKDFSIVGNLIKNKIKIYGKKKKTIKFKNFDINQTYKLQYFDFIKHNKFICSFKEGLELQKLIKNISNLR